MWRKLVVAWLKYFSATDLE